MSERVVCADDPSFQPRLVCGIDVAYSEHNAYAAAIVWDSNEKIFVDKALCVDRAGVPYLPGLLGFREGPILLRTSQQLQKRPDVFLIDGQGVAHPRRFGLACQFGIAAEKPTVGVAKSRLYGTAEEDLILDPEGEAIGSIVSDRKAKKFFVSIGHRISLPTATRIVQSCMVDGHPAPLRQAHLEAETLKRSHAS